ncbi:unnamed protein product [Protopolystoma xenopodis]|uniref:Uncharacterized protein n=1 Tax=Protopolystoma xenopodis TaxID=117903 RepID=A0A448WXB0_9PLAT|nr:unnamed protein product [Protopolystoma xenopodis]
MVASTSDSLSPTNGTAVGVDSNSSGIHMGGPNDGNVIVVHSASGSHLEQFRMNRNSSNGLHMLSPVERNRRASSRAMVKIEDSGVDVDVIVDGLSEDVHQVVDADDLLHAGPHTFIMPSSNEQVVIEEGVEVPLDDCEDAEAAAVAAAEVAAADAADNDLVYSHPEEPDSDSIHHRMLTATEDFPDTPLQNDQADERSDHELSDQAQLSRVQDDTDGTEDEGRRDGGTDEVTIGQATGSPDSDCNTIRFVGRKLPSSFISRLDPHTRVVGVNRSRISSLNGVYSIDHKGLVIKNENILSDHDLSVEDGGLVAGFS